MQYLFTDVETSGLFDYTKPADDPAQPRVAQIGMIFVDGECNIQSRHEFLIKPRGWMMKPEAERVTGFTDSYLHEHGVSIEEPLRLYRSAIESRRIVSGFNITFDIKALRAELRRIREPDLYMATRTMCLMSAARRLVKAKNKLGHIKQPTLQEACLHFGIEQSAAHSALADAMSAYHIWQKVIAAGVTPEVKDPYNKQPKKKPTKSKAERLRDGPDEDETDLQAEIPL